MNSSALHRCSYAVLAVAMLLVGVFPPAVLAETPDVTSLSVEELFADYQRYGDDDGRVVGREEARGALLDRPGDSLPFAMRHIHLENLWVRILALHLVERARPEDGVPVLVSFLEDPKPKTRKYAAYFLGFFQAKEHADRLYPLLGNDVTRRSAIRTLGKWKGKEAVPAIEPYLSDPEERTRIIAANALGDIGSRASLPKLIERLGDEIFTVRKAAAGAIAKIAEDGDRDLVSALDNENPVIVREIIGILSEGRSKRTLKALRKLHKTATGTIHADAVRAIRAIELRRAVR